MSFTALQKLHQKNDINLYGGSITKVKDIELDGTVTGDNITAKIVCNPTQNRTYTFPDRTLTVNSVSDLAGTTLPNAIVNSNIQKLGLQSQDLDMNSHDLDRANRVFAQEYVDTPVLHVDSITAFTIDEGMLTGPVNITNAITLWQNKCNICTEMQQIVRIL